MSTPIYLQPNFSLGQTGSTYKNNIEAAIAASAQPWHNLGCSYSGGTFTIHGMDGTALAAANPAFVRFQSKATPGYNIVVSIEANQNFIDDAGASEIIGNLFGFTTSVAITVDVPFFIYACLADDGTTVTFGLSRIPNLTVAPVTASLGTPASAVADVQYGIFLFDSVTVADYDGNPVVCIGSIRMRMSASDDWTVQTLTTSDGIGQFQEHTNFTVMLGQFGAASGNWMMANGGTAPVWSTYSNYTYKLSRNGICSFAFSMTGDGGTDGAGAVAALVITPFDQAYSNFIGGGRINCSTITDARVELVTNTPGTQGLLLRLATTTATNITNAGFGNASRTLSATGQYEVRTS